MRALVAVVVFSVCSLLSGCTARYILGDSALRDAKARDKFQDLGVYVSHRTIPVYERDEFSQKRVDRTIEDNSRKGRLRVLLGRNLVGLIVDEDLRNGARRLWVAFDRSCRDAKCAFGFVQTEDGRYRLVDLPVRDDYEESSVYRSCVMKRQELKPGKLRALSDANAVYRLERKRKKRPKTVFLEVKRTTKRKTNEKVERPSGN